MNTSENGLVSKLIMEGDSDVKSDFEALLKGDAIEKELDEQIIYNRLKKDDDAIWSLLLATGYLKVDAILRPKSEDEPRCRLLITNYEVRRLLGKMVRDWFCEEKALTPDP